MKKAQLRVVDLLIGQEQSRIRRYVDAVRRDSHASNKDELIARNDGVIEGLTRASNILHEEFGLNGKTERAS